MKGGQEVRNLDRARRTDFPLRVLYVRRPPDQNQYDAGAKKPLTIGCGSSALS